MRIRQHRVMVSDQEERLVDELAAKKWRVADWASIASAQDQIGKVLSLLRDSHSKSIRAVAEAECRVTAISLAMALPGSHLVTRERLSDDTMSIALAKREHLVHARVMAHVRRLGQLRFPHGAEGTPNALANSSACSQAELRMLGMGDCCDESVSDESDASSIFTASSTSDPSACEATAAAQDLAEEDVHFRVSEVLSRIPGLDTFLTRKRLVREQHSVTGTRERVSMFRRRRPRWNPSTLIEGDPWCSEDLSKVARESPGCETPVVHSRAHLHSRRVPSERQFPRLLRDTLAVRLDKLLDSDRELWTTDASEAEELVAQAQAQHQRTRKSSLLAQVKAAAERERKNTMFGLYRADGAPLGKSEALHTRVKREARRQRNLVSELYVAEQPHT